MAPQCSIVTRYINNMTSEKYEFKKGGFYLASSAAQYELAIAACTVQARPEL
jgi:hypothetical protein